MTEQLEYENIFDAVTDDPSVSATMKANADRQIFGRSFCKRLTDDTGITFSVSGDPWEFVGVGSFSYWVLVFTKHNPAAHGFCLIASNGIDHVYDDPLDDEDALIAKINELEDMV